MSHPQPPHPMKHPCNIEGTGEAVDPASNGSDAPQPPRTKRSGAPRVIVPIPAGRGSRQPWPILGNNIGGPVERLLFLLEVARQRKINALQLQSILALHFRDGDSVHLAELAAFVGTTTANITCIADQLEHLGLAARQANHNDRRRIAIALTPHGRSFVHWVHQLLSPPG